MAASKKRALGVVFPGKKISSARTAEEETVTVDTSDHAMFSLVKRLKATDDLEEVRRLSDQLERVIFHRQLENA